MRRGLVWFTEDLRLDDNETATGIVSNIGKIRKAMDSAKHPALLLVDTISSLASIDYRHDEWKVDVTIGFGIRNMTDKKRALKEIYRVLSPGGKILILEFSKIWKPLQFFYDQFSFKFLPKLGKLFAKNESSYQYLVESIRMHPDQESLKKMMEEESFSKVEYLNLSSGVVAIHMGYKL